jgi:cytochrome c peroxidase
MKMTTSAVLAAATLLAACDGVGDRQVPGATTMDAELRALITAEGLTGDPSIGRNLPTVTDPLAQLGMQLFFSKALGGDSDAACVSCHHPMLGGGDDLSLSIGVGAVDPDLLGPGRRHPDARPTVPRNAPTTFNTALWDQYLFLDGRVESLGKEAGMAGRGSGIRTPDVALGSADPAAGIDLLAAQARFPVTSMEEMRGEHFEAEGNNDDVRRHLAERLGGYGDAQAELPGNQWLAAFRAAFGSEEPAESLITYANIAEALAAYQRSQTFVASPWRDYVQGDSGALDDQQKRGALVFFRSPEAGGAGCASCHSGDFFTDEDFHNIAMPQIGPGKGDDGDGDFGRFRESGDEAERFAFRTPTLLNVAVTGPFGHAGAYDSLRETVLHHLDAHSAVAAFDFGLRQLDQFNGDGAELYPQARAHTDAALDHLQAARGSGDSRLPVVTLATRDVDALVAFLEALTDPCVLDRQCMTAWIPGDASPDPDGQRLNAVNRFGDRL